MTPFKRAYDRFRLRAFVIGCIGIPVRLRQMEVTESEIECMADTLIQKLDEYGLVICKTDRYKEGVWDGKGAS